MFSYFGNGIKPIPSRTIDLPALIKIIKNNPEKTLIEWIRVLRKEKNIDECRKLKKTLPYITPNCMVKYRGLKTEKEFTDNFISSSHYIYFDTDDIVNLEEYKKYFIEKYRRLVSMVCKSSSCNGLSFLFKLTNNITSKDQFYQVWNNIRTTILKDEAIDPMCKDIGRAMFISYDPEVYVNYDNEITVEISDCIDSRKEVNHPISYKGVDNKVVYPISQKKVTNTYTALSLNEVLPILITKTKVLVDNPIVDFKPVDYAFIFIPEVIKDGTKHTIYTRMIHQLVYLNPDIDKIYIFSYLFYINNRFAKPRMYINELVSLFDFVYDSIKTTGNNYPTLNTRFVHFNPNYKLTGKKKNSIANILNGYHKRHININKIIAAKQKINDPAIKITQKLIAEITGLSIRTVRKYFNSEPIDMDQVINDINHPITPVVITATTGIEFKEEYLKNIDNVTPENYINPECPMWVWEHEARNNQLAVN